MAYTSANPGRAIAAARPSIDRALRKLFPSTSRLTFNPLFRAAVNAFDVVPRLVFPEFRALPPNHLRIRIGVGNRLFNNQSDFLVHARDFWMFVFAEGIATMHSDILDIGVGCGRWAHWLFLVDVDADIAAGKTPAAEIVVAQPLLYLDRVS